MTQTQKRRMDVQEDTRQQAELEEMEALRKEAGEPEEEDGEEEG